MGAPDDGGRLELQDPLVERMHDPAPLYPYNFPRSPEMDHPRPSRMRPRVTLRLWPIKMRHRLALALETTTDTRPPQTWRTRASPNSSMQH